MSITFSLARKITFRFTTALFLLIFSFPLQAQVRLDNWQTYSSLKDIRGAVADSRGRIWAATSGGVFVYTPGEGEFREFRNTDGLLTLDFTAIQADTANKKVYLGAFDGTITIADEDFRFTHILDIQSSQNFTRKQINDFVIRDSVAYIAVDFGIVVFDVTRNVVIETVNRIGTLQPNVAVTKLLLTDGELWVGTDDGVAQIPLGLPTLRMPQSWTIYQNAEGLPGLKIIDMALHNNIVHAVTPAAVARLEGDKFVKFYDNEYINGVSSLNGDLYFSDLFSLIKAPSEAIRFRAETVGSISGHTALPALGSTLVFFKNFGAALLKGSDTTYIFPNTPTTNEFVKLGLDNEGNLWNVGDVNTAIEAFSVLKDGSWKIFNSREYPVIAPQTYHQVSIAPDNTVWVSAKGSGLWQVRPMGSSYDITRYDSLNTPIRGAAATPNYIVIGETASDPSGVLWAVNRFSPTSLLIARTPQGEFHTFQPRIPVSRFFLPIAIDGLGTKWLGSENGGGLYWFNENKTPANTADDKDGLITASNGVLPDNTQNSLAVDRNGSLWIGMPTGLGVMFNPSAVLNNSSPSIRKINQLSGQFVNDIFVDALNQKWIATRNGVYVLNEDGTEVLKTFTTKDSPLADNDVQSIVINSTTGRAYFGTKKGLSTASTLSITPLTDYSIQVFPQPFRPEADVEITISGLAPDSHVRILTSNGEIVRAFDTQSERLRWDGRNSSGDFAPSGVYIVNAFSKSGGTSSVGKLTLIRR